MSTSLQNNLRIIPRTADYLERRLGNRGEIFFDQTSNALRLYNGQLRGGFELAKADLSNISDADFASKVQASGIEGGSSISVSDQVPINSSNGNLWLNTNNGSLYVYVDDGTSSQWVQPAAPIPVLSDVAYSGNYDDLTNKPVSFSGSYSDLTNKPALFSGSYTDLTDKPVLFSGSYTDLTNKPTGLATEIYVNTAVSNLVNAAPTTLNTLNELAAALGDDANFASTVTTALGTKAPIANPAFTGAVGIGGSASVIQGTSKSGTYLDVKGFLQINPESGAATIDMARLGYRMAVLEASASTTPYLGVYISNSSTSSSVNSVAIFRPVGIDSTSTTTGTFTVSGGVGISNGLTVGGLTTLQQTAEVLNTKTGATGTVIHDFSTGAIWYHSSISANFTANFTNVSTTNNRTVVCTLILLQGVTAYIPNAVQISGVSATIKWIGNEIPTGTASGVDIVSFTLLRTNNAWTVLGSLSSYG